jgi:nucleoside-triphosphatase THEP1
MAADRRAYRPGTMATDARRTCFLIADISGYTEYLADVELDHFPKDGRYLVPIRKAIRLAEGLFEGDVVDVGS